MRCDKIVLFSLGHTGWAVPPFQHYSVKSWWALDPQEFDRNCVCGFNKFFGLWEDDFDQHTISHEMEFLRLSNATGPKLKDFLQRFSCGSLHLQLSHNFVEIRVKPTQHVHKRIYCICSLSFYVRVAIAGKMEDRFYKWKMFGQWPNGLIANYYPELNNGVTNLLARFPSKSNTVKSKRMRVFVWWWKLAPRNSLEKIQRFHVSLILCWSDCVCWHQHS